MTDRAMSAALAPHPAHLCDLPIHALILKDTLHSDGAARHPEDRELVLDWAPDAQEMTAQDTTARAPCIAQHQTHMYMNMHWHGIGISMPGMGWAT